MGSPHDAAQIQVISSFELEKSKCKIISIFEKEEPCDIAQMLGHLFIQIEAFFLRKE